jgi:hypothetical protein
VLRQSGANYINNTTKTLDDSPKDVDLALKTNILSESDALEVYNTLMELIDTGVYWQS